MHVIKNAWNKSRMEYKSISVYGMMRWRKEKTVEQIELDQRF